MVDAPTALDGGTIIPYHFDLKKEVISNKNNKFLLLFNTETTTELNIKAIKDDDLIQKTYTNKFQVKELQENKYFFQFDDLKEICEELTVRISKETINIIEETNSIVISIPLPSSKIKEIIFELKENEVDDKQIIKDLFKLIHEQKQEIINLKNELDDFKKEISFLTKDYITNLDSLIIKSNKDNLTLKNWINPDLNIRANLLYRLSEDGPEVSTFHELCDNKGPTLTIFHLEMGYIVGFFVNLSFDSTSQWKEDDDSFLFNLNQNKKYKKRTDIHSRAFNSKLQCGPSANGLGCNSGETLNYIYHSVNYIDKAFVNGSKILPSNSQLDEDQVEYKVKETEIFQITIG
jgi:hypothetical protein